MTHFLNSPYMNMKMSELMMSSPHNFPCIVNNVQIFAQKYTTKHLPIYISKYIRANIGPVYMRMNRVPKRLSGLLCYTPPRLALTHDLVPKSFLRSTDWFTHSELGYFARSLISGLKVLGIKECWLVQNYKEKGSIVHQFTCFCMENHLWKFQPKRTHINWDMN